MAPPKPEQMQAIYRETIRPVYQFVSRRCGGCRELAEDIVQETYLRAVWTWKGQGLPRQPEAWLKTVARNLLVNHFRRLPSEALPDGLALDLDLGSDLESAERTAWAQWGLSRIGNEFAALLEDFHFDGKSVRQIAQERKLSERAVEGRLRRARQALRRCLEGVAPKKELIP